jgi:hypothetical protein
MGGDSCLSMRFVSGAAKCFTVKFDVGFAAKSFQTVCIPLINALYRSLQPAATSSPRTAHRLTVKFGVGHLH